MTRNMICFVWMLMFLVPVQAAQPTRQPLWPGTPPGTAQELTQGLTQEGDVPELIITQVQSDTPTAGVVILPGGGYGGHAIDHEGHQFAQWFASLGVTSAICTYRLRGKGNRGEGYGHPTPMIDAQRAIQTMRAKAGQYNLDPNRIGVIGFSAGGHLASTVSTRFDPGDVNSQDPIARVSSRPDFSILCYPVILFGSDATHMGSQTRLIGKDASPELIASLSSEQQVTPQTPPTFLFHTVEDTVVPVENSLRYFEACRAQQVPVEMHIFQEGRHGLGLAKGAPGADRWPDLCKDWLTGLQVISAGKP